MVCENLTCACATRNPIEFGPVRWCQTAHVGATSDIAEKTLLWLCACQIESCGAMRILIWLVQNLLGTSCVSERSSCGPVMILADAFLCGRSPYTYYGDLAQSCMNVFPIWRSLTKVLQRSLLEVVVTMRMKFSMWRSWWIGSCGGPCQKIL